MKSVYTDAYAMFLQRLIDARKRAGMSQMRLASRLAKPQSFISKYETGERRLDITEFLHIVYMVRADPHAMIDEVVKAAPELRTRRRKPPVKRDT